MNCELKTELLVAYQQAATLYSKAVANLVKGVGAARRSEYDRIKIAAENARLAAEQARTDFEAHTLEHGCDGNSKSTS